jgi:hypothetical protein
MIATASRSGPEANPLMDKFEGMAITFKAGFGIYGISLISDDNFSATQATRLLNLAARPP